MPRHPLRRLGAWLLADPEPCPGALAHPDGGPGWVCPEPVRQPVAAGSWSMAWDPGADLPPLLVRTDDTGRIQWAPIDPDDPTRPPKADRLW